MAKTEKGLRRTSTKERKKVRKDQNLRRDRLRLLHHFAEAGRLRGRLVPLGRRRGSLGLLRPAAKQSRRSPALLPAAWSARCSRRARARLASSWPMVRGDSSLGVVFRPVGEGGRGPEAASRSSSPAFGVGFHRRCPKVGVVNVALRSVGDELAGRSCNAGCGLNEGVLTQRNQ